MKKQIALSVMVGALVGTSGAYAAAQKQAPAAPEQARTTVVTRAEAQTHAAAAFARMDFNKDGKIDQTDRTARREAARTQAFERLDTDKNGQISKAEFTAERTPGDRGKDEWRGKGGWSGKGRSGDDAPRFGGGHRGHHGRHGGGHPGMMGGKMAEANRDGSITAAEFTNAALARFDAMDANKDGQVTQAERQAAREKMKELRRKPQAATPAS